MSENNDFALVPRPPSAIEKVEPGAKRIFSEIVADALALAKKGPLHGQRPLRIVSVNDEELHLEIVEMIVSHWFKSVTVQSFQDAEEAWRELSRTDPDLLITDDLMGKLTGEDIVRRLADRKVAYPIIVINAYGPERDQWVSDCAKRGVDVTMLRAPYSGESLARALESGLRISRDTTRPVEMAGHRAPAPSVDAEDLETIFKRGVHYYRGRYYAGDSVPPDYTEAVKWFRKAAEQNHAGGQRSLGCCYRDGQGVGQDSTEAVKWFRKAAEHGNPDAQCYLGHCYHDGNGVPQDYEQAAHWYRKAAEHGNYSAQYGLGACYGRGEGVPQDYEQAVHWYRAAAEALEVNALCDLGICYERGRGVSTDRPEAYKLYKFAAKLDCARAAAYLKGIVSRMTAVEMAQGESRYREFTADYADF